MICAGFRVNQLGVGEQTAVGHLDRKNPPVPPQDWHVAHGLPVRRPPFGAGGAAGGCQPLGMVEMRVRAVV